jgi:tetratricopeptide (TPR) repeat protein
MTAWLAVAFVAPALLLPAPAQRSPSTAAVAAVQAWVKAVTDHAPGDHDESVDAIHGMSFDARVDLQGGLPLFFAALKNPGPRIVTSESAHSIGAIARDVGQSPGRDAFLKRAAILHTDAALYGSYDNQPAFPAAAESAAAAKAATTPLLSNHQLTVDNDGQILGSVRADWNWPFARSLLDQLSPRPGADPFVGAWYHATLAHMLRDGLYGEMPPHLARAGELLPDDARILFDQACYAEVLGLPKNQVLLSDEDISQLEARRARVGLGAQGSGPTHLGIPLPELTNGNAERLFRRVLRVDPAFVEARVRLARLLIVRKRYEEADAELTAALAATPVTDVAYHAHLFAARTAQMLGRIDRAIAHAADALAIAPGAQSALLARSQAALLGADVAATIEPLEELRGRTSEVSDPWRDYPLGPGRDADSLLEQLWAMVPGRPGKA